MFTVSAFSLMFRLAPDGRRGQASGLFTGAFLLGGVTGPAFGGVLVTVDLRAPFIVYALALVLATLVVGTLLARSTHVGALPRDPDATPLTISAALRRPTYRAALVSSLATGWAVQGVRVGLLPLFVAVALGREPLWAGIALTVFAVGDGLVLLATSGLSDRRGRRPVVIAGLALVAVGTASLALATLPGTAGLVVLLAASAVAGAGAGLLQPAQGAAVADIVGSRRSGGPALSGFQMAADVGVDHRPGRGGRAGGERVVRRGLRAQRVHRARRPRGVGAGAGGTRGRPGRRFVGGGRGHPPRMTRRSGDVPDGVPDGVMCDRHLRPRDRRRPRGCRPHGAALALRRPARPRRARAAPARGARGRPRRVVGRAAPPSLPPPEAAPAALGHAPPRRRARRPRPPTTARRPTARRWRRSAARWSCTSRRRTPPLEFVERLRDGGPGRGGAPDDDVRAAPRGVRVVGRRRLVVHDGELLPQPAPPLRRADGGRVAGRREVEPRPRQPGAAAEEARRPSASPTPGGPPRTRSTRRSAPTSTGWTCRPSGPTDRGCSR